MVQHYALEHKMNIVNPETNYNSLIIESLYAKTMKVLKRMSVIKEQVYIYILMRKFGWILFNINILKRFIIKL